MGSVDICRVIGCYWLTFLGLMNPPSWRVLWILVHTCFVDVLSFVVCRGLPTGGFFASSNSRLHPSLRRQFCCTAISMFFSAFLALLFMGLLSRSLCNSRDIGGLSIHWLLCGTLFARVTCLYTALSIFFLKNRLWFNLQPWFTQKPCFA